MRWVCAEPTRSCRPRSLMSAKCQRGDTSSNIPPKVTLPLTQRSDLQLFFITSFFSPFSFLFLTNPDERSVHQLRLLTDEELRWPRLNASYQTPPLGFNSTSSSLIVTAAKTLRMKSCIYLRCFIKNVTLLWVVFILLLSLKIFAISGFSSTPLATPHC